VVVERAEAEAIYDQGREVVVAVLLRMDKQIGRLEARVARQDERIAQLERRLNRSSRNSSAPPSSDQPAKTQKRGKGSSGRGRGAQPGHEGRGRDLLPACAVDVVVEHWPSRCVCGHVFCAQERNPVGDPVLHQVEELPELTVRVIEHRAQRVCCPSCGSEPRAQLPAEVASSCFGPRLQAALIALSVRNRVSRRDVVELGEELFGARLSTGSVDAILARASDALEEPYEDLLGRVRATRARSTRMRRAGALPASVARCGAYSPAVTRSSRSRATVTRTTPRACSTAPRRSSPLTAGGHTAACRCAAASCAGHT
jgi:hypothetical protein